jgi:hypothetical protein
MVAIMLDLHFKGLCIVENLVGGGNAIRLVSEYDVRVVLLLMVCFDWLNLTTIILILAIDFVGLEFELEEQMFGVGALAIGELSFFKRFFIPSFACVDLLAWWWMHEERFLNVVFLANCFLGISNS